MQFNFNINEVLRNPIEIIDCHTKLDFYHYNINGITAKNLRTPQKLSYIIDSMGNASKLAQHLPKVITTASKMKDTDHRIYLSKDELSNNGNGEVVGLLKVGFKTLFVYDMYGRQYETRPLCVLDFYIHESKQRQGFGKSIFEYMLKSESVEPYSLAIDRPSSKFLSFLAKHYQLTEPVQQANNFVVFTKFFQALPNSRPQSLSRRLGKPVTTPTANKGGTTGVISVLPISAHVIPSQRMSSAKPLGREHMDSLESQSVSPPRARPVISSSANKLNSQPDKPLVKMSGQQHPEPPLLPRGDNIQHRWYLSPLLETGPPVLSNGKVLPKIPRKPSPSPKACPVNNMVTCQSAARSTPSLASEARQPIGMMRRHDGQRDTSDYNYLVGLSRNYSHTRIW